MTQPAPNPTGLPAAPVGVPAWLVRLAAAVLAVAGPVFAWLDPGNHLPHGAIQACVIVAFLLVGAVIFLAHLILSAVHEYGWNLNAAQHVATEAEAEFKTQWPSIQASYAAAKPVLDQLPGFQSTVDDITGKVAELDNRTKAAGLNPEAVVNALETVTGMTFPRANTTPVPSPSPTAGQAS